jgi:hypothetical protein
MFTLGRRGVTRVRMLLGLLVCSTTLAAAAPAQAAPTFVRGFTDDIWFTTGTPSLWINKTEATGAQRVLLEVDWQSVEPSKPTSSSQALNPNGPAYNFSYLDARVREFAGTGLSVAFLVTDAPRWAEQSGGPAALEATGGYRPNDNAFGQMATAMARRYSGSFPDPANPGRTLPKVSYFQAWAEPNLNIHLSPQWVRSGGHLVETGPTIYRGLLNAFYSGIKAGDPSALVLDGGLGPYGDSPSASMNSRMHPAEFLRGVLCVSGRSLTPVSCPNPAHYDILTADPYDVDSPTTHAVNADDVSAPDLYKLTRIQRAALAHGRLLPNTSKQFWVTEFAYDSKPGNPYGLSLSTQARWLEQSMYVFWSQGVNTAIWYLVRDQLPKFNANDYYSGVYLYSGKRKPSFTAFRFPFVVVSYKRAARAWGIAPAGGKLVVQHKKGGHWVKVFSTHVSRNGVFVHKVSKRLKGRFRAVVARQKSLSWKR